MLNNPNIVPDSLNPAHLSGEHVDTIRDVTNVACCSPNNTTESESTCPAQSINNSNISLVNRDNITFGAIKDFVADLVSVFGIGGSRKSPLGYYSSLIKQVDSADITKGIDKYVGGFASFFAKYRQYLDDVGTMDKIPRNTTIPYGDHPKIYLEIQKYIFLSSKKRDQLETIRLHLLTIYASMNNDEKALELISTPKNVNKDFIQANLDNIKNIFDNCDIDLSNPHEAVMKLVETGAINNLIRDLEKGVGSGALNLDEITKNLDETMGGMSGDGFDMKQVTMMMQSAMIHHMGVEDDVSSAGSHSFHTDVEEVD